MGLFSKKKETGMREEAVTFISNFHLERARDAVKKSDYKTAEKEYRMSLSCLKKDNPEEFRAVSEEYENFAKQDPRYKEIANVFLAGMKEHPEITTLDINCGGQAKNWGEMYGLGRTLEPIDIKYFFNFAEKFDLIKIDDATGRIYING